MTGSIRVSKWTAHCPSHPHAAVLAGSAPVPPPMTHCSSDVTTGLPHLCARAAGQWGSAGTQQHGRRRTLKRSAEAALLLAAAEPGPGDRQPSAGSQAKELSENKRARTKERSKEFFEAGAFVVFANHIASGTGGAAESDADADILLALRWLRLPPSERQALAKRFREVLMVVDEAEELTQGPQHVPRPPLARCIVDVDALP
eukprot:GGOE01044418.1.p2 GENE.GGOE01044418.1~~GGOE01044418.1.p2  ORF type:complete len:210 (-),score=23.32 GGOE01044418.1:408-1013(-)